MGWKKISNGIMLTHISLIIFYVFNQCVFCTRVKCYNLYYLPRVWCLCHLRFFNTLRLRQNGRHFADDIFKYIFLNENTSVSINTSLEFVPQGRINNIPSLVQIMAWRRLGDKPLSEPMMVSLLTHICVTRPQWVKIISVHICIVQSHSNMISFLAIAHNIPHNMLVIVK